MTSLSRSATLCLFLSLATVVLPTVNGQQIKEKTVRLTPDDRAVYKFLPLQEGGRVRLQGGMEARAGVSLALKPNDKKVSLQLYLGGTNESKSKVWLTVQVRMPGNAAQEKVIEIKPDDFNAQRFEIKDLACETDYPVHLAAYSDKDRKHTTGTLDTAFHFDESCHQIMEKAQSAISDAAREGVFADVIYSGWNEPPSAEELEHRKMAAERLEFTPPTGWKIGNSSGDQDISIIEMIPPGEKIENWSELLTIQSLKKSAFRYPTPGEMLEGLKAQREKECPASTKWNVIETGTNTITYEWWQPGTCHGWPEQTEIAKIFYGPYTVFLLRYTKKVKELPAEEREVWIKRFGETRVGGSE